MPDQPFPRALADLERLPKPGTRGRLAGAPGASAALMLADLARRCRGAGRELVVVCADASDISRLADEIAWLDPSLRISAFPDWETLP